MGAYRYNGVKLPALPEWDTDALPYAHIQYIPYRDGSFIAHLRCSDQPFCVAAGTVTNPEGAVMLIRSYVDGSSDYSWGTEYTTENAVLSLDPDSVIWCNADITDESGTVFLAASEPVPVQAVTAPDFRLYSWLFGFAVGLAGSPLGATEDESAPTDA